MKIAENIPVRAARKILAERYKSRKHGKIRNGLVDLSFEDDAEYFALKEVMFEMARAKGAQVGSPDR
ncbi:hypothetical protein [Dyadobacter sandarakinus]|uniref:Uncharacterized protein n=1 Tax=Dyadobacter sandarakinus TaxID=2747268 RepID=A0ABX7I0X2_9BACT|nr:hypothetical protein [Dyadobacter sandarakinus]QRQ99700.1 hypothetical protein HWI92_01610 [Dyadobacter sandarakinus]